MQVNLLFYCVDGGITNWNHHHDYLKLINCCNLMTYHQQSLFDCLEDQILDNPNADHMKMSWKLVNRQEISMKRKLRDKHW